MIFLFGLVAIIVFGAIIAVNFYPPVRDKWKKYSVVFEGFAATGLYWFGQATDALKDAQAAGYLPSQWLGYLPYVFLAYLLVTHIREAASKK